MKTNYFISFCLAALLQLSVCQLNGQSDKAVESPHGTVFLHTSDSRYLRGESILFKAYITGDTDHPGSIGNNLYVAVLDQEGLEVAKAAFPVKDGQAAGNIGLSDFLAEGNYLLIACTDIMKSATPRDIFSKVIEIDRSEKTEFYTVIKLTDTLYKPGSLLNSKISFSGKGGVPVPVSFNYKLTGSTGEIFAGKSKSGNDGTAIISLQLPVFKSDENIKLLIAATYNGREINSGIVIPTTCSRIFTEKESVLNLPLNNRKQIFIRINSDKQLYKNNEFIKADIFVTDDKGSPVVAKISVSASNTVFNSAQFPNDKMLTTSVPEFNFLWRRIINSSEDIIPQILNDDKEIRTLSGSVFSTGLKKLFAGYLSLMNQSPGRQFEVQEKNDVKKIFSKKENKARQQQEGYSPNLSIFDILRQIKPYHMIGDKIVFTSSGITSINEQDGAIIVINGINSGTDSRIFDNIDVSDIAKITASTNSMDIQRYSGMNTVGVIEITTKKGGNKDLAEAKPASIKSNSLFWEPDLNTDSSGKASISFLNSSSAPVEISVAGISAGGLLGIKTIQLSAN